MEIKNNNPFEIKTPETNSAEDILELFVDVFPDFWQVKETGHTFLNGPRGSGKSMMFRYMMPDCQMLKTGSKACDLDYFAVYVGIKQTNINNTDLERLSNHATLIINEHLLSTFVIANVLGSIRQTFNDDLNDYTEEIRRFYRDTFVEVVVQSGYEGGIEKDCDGCEGNNLFLRMINVVESMEKECKKYCNRLALNRDLATPYTGALTDFVDFVSPIITGLKQISLFPQGKPFYILIDDAGYLNLAQTKVLNTWVSYRSTKDICLKISAQLDYKTHLTANDKRIEAPHDYSEINISTVYSSKTSDYNVRIKEIVRKRLEKYLNLKIEPEMFFPQDEEQEAAINAIAKKLAEDNYDPERPYASGDAARRYARPDFIKDLQKNHKSGATYSYAGFDQLVAISSGIIRYFLAPAQEMFSVMVAKNPNTEIREITPGVQDEVIKRYSDNFLQGQFDEIRKDQGVKNFTLEKADKLYNLVDSLGELFHVILVSNASERRVFSVALTDSPDEELYEILDKCEHYGYIHKRTIGNKEGTGRNRMYVLSRVLSPHFKLDPMSFAGYKFMDSATLKIALTSKKKFLQAMSKGIAQDTPAQPTLFDNPDFESND